MLETPQITRSDARRAAVIRLTIPRERIRDVMAPGLGELMAAVAAQGVDVTGPWYTRHLRMDPEVFDFEIGVPVAAPVAAVGRVRAGALPGGRVARAVYRGPYEGLERAWDELDRWIAGGGHAPAASLWECYVVGPETVRDPDAWRTELNRPLVDPPGAA